MSFWGGVSSFVGGVVSSIFGGGSSSSSGGGGSYSSSSSTVTHRDPDKVRVAELENDRVGLVRDAQLELMQVNAQLEAAMIEARCRGFHAMSQSMMGMLKEVNVLAEERLVLLENATHQQVKQVESMYDDLTKDMQNDGFMQEKVPQLLAMAEKFAPESDSRKLFMSGIDREMASHFEFKTHQLKQIGERCRVVVDSVVRSKEQMQAHIDSVVVKRIEQIEQTIQSNTRLEFKGAALQLDAPAAPAQTNADVKLVGNH